MKNFDTLKLDKRWVCFLIKKEGTKTIKRPINPHTGKMASCSNPEHWGTYEECKEYAKKHNLSVAIVLKGDGLCCVDLDHCISETGSFNPEALEIIKTLNSYTEKSVSNRGVHILVFCNEKFKKTRSDDKIPIEIYSDKRFMIITENLLVGNEIEERSIQLKSIYDLYIGTNKVEDKIKLNKNDWEKYKKLMKGDFSDYANDHSRADLALANIISKHVKTKEEFVDVFKETPLNRDKFENRQDYIDRLWNLVKKDVKSNYKEYKKEKEDNQYITEREICLLLKIKYDKFIFNIDENAYYYFNGKYYQKDTTQYLTRCLADVIESFATTCGWSNNQIKKLRTTYLGKKGSDNIYDYFKSIKDISQDHTYFNQNKHLICCKNGMVNLRNGDLLPFDKEYRITKYININYNPKTTIEGTVFQDFLNRVTKNEKYDDIAYYLQILAGYILTGETNQQSLYYLVGPGSTGKTTFVELLTLISGTNAKSVPLNCFDVKSNDFLTNMAAVSDARLVTSAEENSSTKMNTSLVKQLTGEDTITARFLYAKIFSYLPQFKIIVSTNETPQMLSDVSSMKRRIKPIPFYNVIEDEDKDRHLKQKLYNELEIILNWAVNGAIEYYEIGFPKPQFIDDLVNEIFDEQDELLDWLHECCVDDINAYTTSQDLYTSYSDYCEKYKTTKIYKTQNALIKAIKRRDVNRKYKSGQLGVRHLKGIRLKNPISH